MRRISIGIVTAALVGIAIAGAVLSRDAPADASGPDYGAPPRSTFSLAQARSFGEFPIYNVGASFGGVPLAAVLRRHDAAGAGGAGEPIKANYVSFVYGDCNAEPDGCAPPLEVQVWPACVRTPVDIAAAEDGQTSVRGAAGVFFDEETRLEIVTGTSTVVLFAVAGRETLLRAAAELRGVNVDVAPAEPLPPPAAYASTGALECGR